MNVVKNLFFKSVVFLFAIALMFVGVGCNDNAKVKSANEFKTLAELNGKRIAVQSGCGYDEVIKKRNIKADISFFSDIPDILVAIRRGKIDAFVTENLYLDILKKECPELKIIPEILESKEVGMAFGKKPMQGKYQAQMNGFVDDCQANGVLNSIYEYWVKNYDEDKCDLPEVEFPKESPTITIAFESAYPPFSYFKGNRPIGYDIDLINRFCLKYGYKPEYIPLTFDSISPSLETGKFDVGVGTYLTDERQGSGLCFSKSYLTLNIVAAYLSSEVAVKEPFLENLKNSFYRNFLKDDRWKMFLNGFGITVLIVLSSIVIGTLLGFGIYLLCRYSARTRKAVNYISIVIKSIPTVLFLMIFYYIIFGNVAALPVSIICFSLLFCFAVNDMIEAGVKAVGENQLEAAIAQGFSDSSAFFNIILPQAALHFLPTYRDEVISLIKETAVVGYIAVMDITKTCDVIRGLTFEAFFPLISTTIIYFILIGILVVSIKRFNISIIPEKRSRSQIVSGINTDVGEA